MQTTYVLGIDTGGTYTDAMIYKFTDDDNDVIAAAKSLTTKNNLCDGITAAVKALDNALLQRVSRVALSTTLATNACVEGRGGRCGLILIGGDKNVITARRTEFSLPPTAEICFLDGRINLDGNVAEEFDPDAREKISSLLSATPCVAISGMLSVRNPAHEYAVRDLVTELGGVSVCSRDVAPEELNYLRRASTALLNARLLPVIGEFLTAVKQSLWGLGVNAPICVVRSDGSLMSEEFAMLRPVETLLSGPTASVVGAMNLVGGGGVIDNAVIADIGGTTTDLALAEGGIPVKTGAGIEIGNWKTSVSSTYIDTFGLGGDSRVIIDRDARLTNCTDKFPAPFVLKEERVVPLCVLAARHPNVVEALRGLAEYKYQGLSRRYELLELVKYPSDVELSDRELEICGLLQGGPLTLPDIAERAGIELLSMDTNRLETRGYVIRSGFTPTDAMHILGLFREFNVEASFLGARYFERHTGLDPEAFARAVIDMASFKFYSGIVKLCARRYIGGFCTGAAFDVLLHTAWESDEACVFRPAFFSSAVLVGVGAPTAVIAGKAAEKLGMRLVIPPLAGIANAVGTAVCTVRCEVGVFIRPSFDNTGVGGYIVMGGSENAMFDDYDAALACAKYQAESLARASALQRGLTGKITVTFNEEKHDSTAATESGQITVELGARITAIARAAEV